MAQSLMRDRLDRISERTGQKLDRLSELLPDAVGRQIPFDEYRGQAELYAITDPAFGEQYRNALRQYETVQGVEDAMG